LNEKGERMEARAISDWSNEVGEVCIKRVVYYTYFYGNRAGISPKIVPRGNQFNKPFIEKC